MSTARWNLKEAVGKPLVRRTEITYKAGKLVLPGKEELAELRKRITEYTAKIVENKGYEPAEASGPDDFYMIREQLIRQKEILV